jgi:hypothetical protein
MRTLDEIIEAIKTNQPVTHDEAIYSVLVLTSVANDLSYKFGDLLCNGWSDFKKELFKKQKTSMYNRALNNPPDKFMGWDNDPRNPDYQKFHAIGLKIADKAIKGELPNQKASGVLPAGGET